MKFIIKIFTTIFSTSFMRYLFVGTTTVFIDMGFLIVLHGILGINLAMAITVAYWVSIAYNFSLNRFWTFSVSEKTGLHKHLVMYLVLLGLNYLFTLVFVTQASKHIHYTYAKMLAIAIQISWTYPIYKLVIFKKRSLANDQVSGVDE